MYARMYASPKNLPKMKDYKPSLTWNTLQAYRERDLFSYLYIHICTDIYIYTHIERER